MNPFAIEVQRLTKCYGGRTVVDHIEPKTAATPVNPTMDAINIGYLVETLKSAKGALSVAAFGHAVHVAGKDAALLERALTPLNANPAPHFLRIVRGILLKGNSFEQLWPQVWPMLLFLLVAAVVALKRYRQTLD